MGKNAVTLKFVDFWPTFNHHDNKFVKALRASRPVEVLDADSSLQPDILIYSNRGNCSHFAYDCLKIYYTGENDFPDFNECDYAISFYDTDCMGRNLRYPLYMLYECDQAVNAPQLNDAQALQRDFCSLVMSNAVTCDPRRLEIIEGVEKAGEITFGGAYRKNVPGRVENKIDFIGHFRFNLALENSNVPGYVTEKLLEPYAAATVPIYWGCREALKDFNPDSFIFVDDYYTLDSLAAYLKYLDSHPQEYLQILRAPSGIADTVADFDSRLAEFLGHIADTMQRHRCAYGMMGQKNRCASTVNPLWSRKWPRKAVKALYRLSGWKR